MCVSVCLRACCSYVCLRKITQNVLKIVCGKVGRGPRDIMVNFEVDPDNSCKVIAFEKIYF